MRSRRTWISRPSSRVSSISRSPRSPSANGRYIRDSPFSASRTGIHSRQARRAAAVRPSHSPSPWLMIRRPAGPRIIGDVVVVSHDDEGMLAVRGLQIGVLAVLRVAGAVVLERQDLAIGRRQPSRRARIALGPARIVSAAVLVEIVAQMDHRIQVAPFGDPPIDVEEPERKVGAGRQRQPDRGCRPGRQRARPADR